MANLGHLIQEWRAGNWWVRPAARVRETRFRRNIARKWFILIILFRAQLSKFIFYSSLSFPSLLIIFLVMGGISLNSHLQEKLIQDRTKRRPPFWFPLFFKRGRIFKIIINYQQGRLQKALAAKAAVKLGKSFSSAKAAKEERKQFSQQNIGKIFCFFKKRLISSKNFLSQKAAKK